MAGWVLGCHRSGTSLLCGLLRSATGLSHSDLLGGDIPDSAANPVGHHESAALLSVNEQLLQACGSSWDQPFAQPPNWQQVDWHALLERCRPRLTGHRQHRLWIDKDPRLCLTRPAVEAILERPLPAIAILRHPLAVARSLQQRDGFPLEHSARIWLLYNRHLFNSPCQPPSAVLLFDQLIAGEPEQEQRLLDALNGFLQQVHQEAGRAGPLPWQQDLRALLASARKPELVRSQASWPSTDRRERRLVSKLNALWHEAQALATQTDLPALAQLFAQAARPSRRQRLQAWWHRFSRQP